MGESESDIPSQEKFSTRKEEQEFSAIHFDPNVRRAMEAMEQHADELAGEPANPIEHLLEEFIAERKKVLPDQAKLEDIRHRMNQEHVLVAAQTITPENEARHRRDVLESEMLNQRENSVNEIMKIRGMLEGLEQDIRDLADQAIGETAEEYPEPLAEILDEVTAIRENVFDDVREVLGLEEPDPDTDGMIPLTLLSEKELLAAPGKALFKTYGLLLKARNEMIDEHSKMLKAASEWRQKHQAK